MNADSIYTLPGSLAATAFLAWPLSRCGSGSLAERIKFCLFSLLGVAALAWDIQPHAKAFHGPVRDVAVAGTLIAAMAATFLLILWIEKINELLTDLLFGFIDSSDDRPLVLAEDPKQIEKAGRLFREGKHRRALRLCHRIIESNSQYASTAATFAYWIENPGTVKILKPPRIAIRLKGRLSRLNGLWTV